MPAETGTSSPQTETAHRMASAIVPPVEVEYEAERRTQQPKPLAPPGSKPSTIMIDLTRGHDVGLSR
jgi:hypothetical protein